MKTTHGASGTTRLRNVEAVSLDMAYRPLFPFDCFVSLMIVYCNWTVHTATRLSHLGFEPKRYRTLDTYAVMVSIA
jgi:hypothetical protein